MVQAILRVLCLHSANGDGDSKTAVTMLTASRALAEQQERSTALTRARIGMTALDLTRNSHTRAFPPLAGGADRQRGRRRLHRPGHARPA